MMVKSLPLLMLFAVQLCYANKTETTVYTAGDIADCRTPELAAQSAATAELIKKGIAQDPNAIVLTIGDHTYPVGTPKEFETCYHPTWGEFKDRTYPAPGNHEYYTPKAYPYFQYFGKAAGSQQRPYYSFDKGNWHIISLDSNLKKEQQQAQLAWLKKDLKANESSCILAVWHHPVYSSGLRGNNSVMQPAWKMLIDAKADLVLSGHDHYYERFAPQDSHGKKDEDAGIREIIVGTGGAKLTPALYRKENSVALNTKTFGVLKLSLKQQSYEWEFLPIEGSAFTDQGSADCKVK